MIFSVANQKGGVGKTTVAIHVAAALQKQGHSVLFVDLDPQGNATENLGFMELYDAEPPSLFDCLTEPRKRGSVNDLILRDHPEMDIIPSNIDMTAVEPKLTVSRRGGEQLDLLLDHVDTNYDFTVIDSPPYLGNLMDNALFASKNVLIPALAESTSRRAFELLFDHVESLALEYEITIQELGVVMNRIDVRKNQAIEMVDWVNQAFDDTPVWEVRERADIQKALESGQSLLEFNPDNDMCSVFDSIADHLIQRSEH